LSFIRLGIGHPCTEAEIEVGVNGTLSPCCGHWGKVFDANFGRTMKASLSKEDVNYALKHLKKTEKRRIYKDN